MKIYNKFIVVILLLSVVCSLLVGLCSCEQGVSVTIDGIEFLIFEKNREAQFVMLEYVGDTDPIVVVVPAYVIYNDVTYPVTKISAQLGYMLGAGPPRSIVDNGYMKELVVPETVESIDFGMYQSLEYFERITVNPQNYRYKDIDGVLYTALGKKLVAYPNAKPNDYYIVPDTVNELALNVFNCSANLKTIYIHENIEKLSDEYFAKGITVYCGKPAALDKWGLNLDNGQYHFGVALDEYLAIIGKQS